MLRCDLNVPFDDNETLLDDTRITSIIPTINYLAQSGAKIVLASHFGRPNGKVDPKLSLRKLIPYLETYYNVSVKFIADIFSQDSVDIIKQLHSTEIALLENLRFHEGEESNDKSFAKQLSKFCDIYVNDAFSCCHRRHASIEAITEFVPSYPGLLVANEMQHLNTALNGNRRPQTLIIGGKKISTKLSVLKTWQTKWTT